MTDSILSIETALPDAYNYINFDLISLKDGLNITYKTSCSRKNDSILQENARRLKKLITISVMNVFQYCLIMLKMHIVRNDGDEIVRIIKNSALPFGRLNERMDSIE